WSIDPSVGRPGRGVSRGASARPVCSRPPSLGGGGGLLGGLLALLGQILGRQVAGFPVDAADLVLARAGLGDAAAGALDEPSGGGGDALGGHVKADADALFGYAAQDLQ